MSLPIAYQVYSVRGEAEADFKGTMENIKKMGYNGVELAGLYGYSVNEIKSILDEVGLVLVSAHIPVAELEKEEILAAYSAAGVKYAVIPWMQVKPDEKIVDDCVEKIRKIAVLCKKHGMTLLYHNHDFEFKKVNGKYILDIYYSSVSSDLLQTELDTCWVNVGGENPATYLSKYSGRAPLVHLKDFAGQQSDNMYGLIGTDSKKADTTGEFELRPVGSGLQDIPSIIAAAEKAGTKWIIVEQDEPSEGKTPLECAEISINYLKSNYINK